MTARPKQERLALNTELREPTAVTASTATRPASAERPPRRAATQSRRENSTADASADRRSRGAARTDATQLRIAAAATPTPQPASGRRGRQVWVRFDVDQWERLRALKRATDGVVTPASLLGELIDRHLPTDTAVVVALLRAYDRGRAEPPATAEHVLRLAPATHAKLLRVEAAVKRELDWATRADLLAALIDHAAPTSAAEAVHRIRENERIRRHGTQAAAAPPSQASASTELTAPSSPTATKRS